MTTLSDIRGWFKNGLEKKATHLMVVCDTFDHEEYPVYVQGSEDVRDKYDDYANKNMQKVLEVYNLSLDMEEQLAESPRTFNF